MREIAYIHIQRKIASRHLRAGAPVSDVAIANELGISRTPAREAMRQLASEGLLDTVPGRGLVVVTLERSDINDLYEMREVLEVRAARNVAQQPGGAQGLRNLRQVSQEMNILIKELEKSRKPLLDEGQMLRFEGADLAFHTYLMSLAGNRRSLKTVNGIQRLIRIFAVRRSGHDLTALKRVHQGHMDVIAAVETGDAEGAAMAISKHITASWRERLDQFERREREAAVPNNIQGFLEKIHAELG